MVVKLSNPSLKELSELPIKIVRLNDGYGIEENGRITYVNLSQRVIYIDGYRRVVINDKRIELYLPEKFTPSFLFDPNALKLYAVIELPDTPIVYEDGVNRIIIKLP